MLLHCITQHALLSSDIVSGDESRVGFQQQICSILKPSTTCNFQIVTSFWSAVEQCWQELVDKMFEALSVVSCDIQTEIISCIPEVIDDLQHVDVAHRLKSVSVGCSWLGWLSHSNI